MKEIGGCSSEEHSKILCPKTKLISIHKFFSFEYTSSKLIHIVYLAEIKRKHWLYYGIAYYNLFG